MSSGYLLNSSSQIYIALISHFCFLGLFWGAYEIKLDRIAFSLFVDGGKQLFLRWDLFLLLYCLILKRFISKFQGRSGVGGGFVILNSWVVEVFLFVLGPFHKWFYGITLCFYLFISNTELLFQRVISILQLICIIYDFLLDTLALNWF